MGVVEDCLSRCRRQGGSLAECEARCEAGYPIIAAGAARQGAIDHKVIGAKDRFVRDVKDMVKSHGKCTEASQAGRAAEAWHKATFNTDAMQKDIGARAAGTHYHAPADLKIGDAEAQVKFGGPSNLKSLNNSKYDGMQKIVPKGAANPGKGWSETVKAQGAESKPLSNEEAKKALKNARGLIDKKVPTDNLGTSAAKAGLQGAALGGAFSGIVDAGASLWRGEEADIAAKNGLASGMQGALTSGVASATSDVVAQATGEAALGAFGGGLAGGAVTTAFNVHQCTNKYDEESDRKKCREEEFVFGTLTTTGQCTATLACSLVIGPFAPACGMGFGAFMRNMKK
mmetsp:Transcript_64591/g.154335  ORF Transcript_64591/g.154335 Transcript_64591/m.154335 type:complete len:343 (+) Transcript_64591:76-1104(+)